MDNYKAYFEDAPVRFEFNPMGRIHSRIYDARRTVVRLAGRVLDSARQMMSELISALRGRL